MGNILSVTSNQSDAIRDMANEKGVGRANWQKAHDDGRFARFLDGLKSGTQTILQPFRTFTIQKDGSNAEMLLSRMDGSYFVSDLAKGMMNENTHFVIGPKEAAHLGLFTCDQLGVKGWAEADFFGPKGWEHIRQFGLAKCLPDDGPYVRLAQPKQKLGAWFRVGHDPIPFDGYSYVWYVGHDKHCGRYLGGWDLDSGFRLGAGRLVCLRLA